MWVSGPGIQVRLQGLQQKEVAFIGVEKDLTVCLGLSFMKCVSHKVCFFNQIPIKYI